MTTAATLARNDAGHPLPLNEQSTVDSRSHHRRISPRALRGALNSGSELAVLDVREEGVFARKHVLYASSAPLWRIELVIDALVPRRSAPIILTDLDESLVHDAAAKLERLGYHDVTILEGGTLAWEREGFEVYSGTNVPSKAFGELIETTLHTPTIEVAELRERLARGDKLVVVDSRSPEEFETFNLPGAHSLPGAELVYRIGELAPDPDTLVVVNCAGRTRSILGAQTLVNAGIPNRVASLKDGTMAWLLSGHTLANGTPSSPPEPSEATLDAARTRARRVAAKAGVRHISSEELQAFEAEAEAHTLYKFDVRLKEEYQAGHLPGWRWAPGGQLVQATDDYIGTRNARVVIADWDGVRALTAAAWLKQLGGHEVFLYAPPVQAALEIGPERVRVLQSSDVTAPWIAPLSAHDLLLAERAVVFDVDKSLAFAKQHIQGARFSAPDRLPSFIGTVPAEKTIIITSTDGVLARAVSSELRRQGAGDVLALRGGTDAWIAAGLPTASGRDGILTGDDDAWYFAYVYETKEEREREMRAYLAWELGLVEQLQRDDPTISLIDYRR